MGFVEYRFVISIKQALGFYIYRKKKALLSKALSVQDFLGSLTLAIQLVPT